MSAGSRTDMETEGPFCECEVLEFSSSPTVKVDPQMKEYPLTRDPLRTILGQSCLCGWFESSTEDTHRGNHRGSQRCHSCGPRRRICTTVRSILVGYSFTCMQEQLR